MSLGLFKLLHIPLFLVLSGLFLGSCQNLGEQEPAPLSVKYYQEQEPRSQPQEIHSMDLDSLLFEIDGSGGAQGLQQLMY